MPTQTAPYVETQQVVTGTMYQLYIAEESDGRGITRMDIGPYYFDGVVPRVKYPEAVTNEMCLPGWEGIRWYTDNSGASWLRWQGGILEPETGEVIFQMTSNYPAAGDAAGLYVWRRGKDQPVRYPIQAPDYSKAPPHINPRHDVTGLGTTFAPKSGCAPVVLGLILCGAATLLRHLLV